MYYSFGCAVAFGLVLALLSFGANRSSPWYIERTDDGGVRFSRMGAGRDMLRVAFCLDSKCLGELYGKEIRRAIDDGGYLVGTFVVYPVGSVPKLENLQPDIVFAFGPRVKEIESNKARWIYIAVLPVGSTPALATGEPDLVVIPSRDQIGYAKMWESWALSNRKVVLEVVGVGQDLRSRWLELFKQCLSGVGTREA